MALSVEAEVLTIRKDGLDLLKRGVRLTDAQPQLNRLEELRAQCGRTRDLSEAYVLHCILARQRPGRARGYLKLLKHLGERAGEPARFMAFEQQIRAYLGDEVIGGRDFAPMGIGALDQETIFAEARGVAEFVADMGYGSFASGGTLLGLVRDGRLVGLGDTVDLGVAIRVRSDEEAAARWLDLRTQIGAADAPYLLKKTPGEAIRLKTQSGLEVDLMPAWGTRVDFNVYPYAREKLKHSDIWPFRPCQISGLALPASPEHVLEASFGEDWREPDPHFDAPSSARRKEFEPFVGAIRAA